MIKSKIGNEIIDCTKIKSINEDMAYSKMKELLAGDKTFVLNDQGKISDPPQTVTSSG